VAETARAARAPIRRKVHATSPKHLSRKPFLPPPDFCGFLGKGSPPPSATGRNRAAVGAIA
jgi:hypothetical protein